VPLHQAVCNQRGTVEVRLGDVKCPGRCQSIERAVFLLKDVFWNVITERMENVFRSHGLIIIAFVFVANMAAIDEIDRSIRAALRTRLEMIYC
jgi:hypothetical protein